MGLTGDPSVIHQTYGRAYISVFVECRNVRHASDASHEQAQSDGATAEFTRIVASR